LRGRLRPGEDREFRAYQETTRAIALPRGLLPAARRLTTLTVHDRRFVQPPDPWTFQGRLRPEQWALVDRLWRNEGGTLVAPPGSGKTVMGLAAAAAWGQRTLWLTHRHDLAQQVITEARRLFEWPPAAVGFTGGTQRDEGTRLTVAMLQTVARDPAAVAGEAYGTVVVDECHHVPSRTFMAALSRLPGRYRLGLSATPDRADGLGPLVPALMGGLVAVPDEYWVQQRRIIVPDVYLLPTAFTAEPHVPWVVLQHQRARDPARNRLILMAARTCALQGRRVLLLTEGVQHARWLARALQGWKLPAEAVVGAVPQGVRRLLYRSSRDPGMILVATRLADEGLDLPWLDTLILAMPGRSAPRLQQQIGRVFRNYPGKHPPWVIDVVDGRVPILAQHAAARRRGYERWRAALKAWPPRAEVTA
jgi:superfamily II DNA or RNA helicase